MVRETAISPDCFIYPLFVTFGRGVKKEISSMPGCYQESVDVIVGSAKEAHSLGIPAIMLFGIPENKDELGTSAYDEKGVVQDAIKAIKNALPELYVITDVCMWNIRATDTAGSLTMAMWTMIKLSGCLPWKPCPMQGPGPI